MYTTKDLEAGTFVCEYAGNFLKRVPINRLIFAGNAFAGKLSQQILSEARLD